MFLRNNIWKKKSMLQILCYYVLILFVGLKFVKTVYPLIFLGIFCFGPVFYQIWLSVEPVSRFSNVPKLYGPFSGVTIPFVSQDQKGFKSSNFTVIFLFVKQGKRSAFQNKRLAVSQMAFRAWKVIGTFEKLPPDKAPLRIKNKAPHSQRTSIVIAIVFLKQRSVCIMSRDQCGNLAK